MTDLTSTYTICHFIYYNSGFENQVLVISTSITLKISEENLYINTLHYIHLYAIRNVQVIANIFVYLYFNILIINYKLKKKTPKISIYRNTKKKFKYFQVTKILLNMKETHTIHLRINYTEALGLKVQNTCFVLCHHARWWPQI